VEETKPMRLNTTKSMMLARRVKGRFGTWQAVREASDVQNGVFVVEARTKREDAKPKARPNVPA
jgi:hypothetical protein